MADKLLVLQMSSWMSLEKESKSEDQVSMRNETMILANWVKLPDKSEFKVFSEVVGYLKIVGRHFIRHSIGTGEGSAKLTKQFCCLPATVLDWEFPNSSFQLAF